MLIADTQKEIAEDSNTVGGKLKRDSGKLKRGSGKLKRVSRKF